MRRALQHSQCGDHFSGRDPLVQDFFQIIGIMFGRGKIGQEDHRAADTHDHVGSSYIEGLLVVELFLHIEQQRAFHEVHVHRLPLLGEIHAGHGVQSDDFALVKTDGGSAFFPCLHGFAAAKAAILHKGA